MDIGKCATCLYIRLGHFPTAHQNQNSNHELHTAAKVVAAAFAQCLPQVGPISSRLLAGAEATWGDMKVWKLGFKTKRGNSVDTGFSKRIGKNN